MPMRSVNAAAAIMANAAQEAQAVDGGEQDSDNSDWEPPSGRLGSVLNLQDLDVVKRNDSFDALSELPNAPTLSRFGTDNGGEQYQPPPFAFGSAPPVPPGPPPQR